MANTLCVVVYAVIYYVQLAECTVESDRTILTKLAILEEEISAIKGSIQRNEVGQRANLRILRHDINLKLESIAAKALSGIIDDKVKTGEIAGVVDGSVNTLLQHQQQQLQQMKYFVRSVGTCQTVTIPKKIEGSWKKLNKRFRVVNKRLKTHDNAIADLQDEIRDLKKKINRTILISVKKGVPACTKASISDHSFEAGTDWADYGEEGWTSVSEEAQDGSKSAKVTDGGAVKEILFSKPIHKLTLSAYSKNVDGPSSIGHQSDYSLYCDLQKENGDNIWGRYMPFTLQDSNWHKVTLIIDETDAFVMARCHLLYRNVNQGAAYFDNIFGSAASDDVTDISQCS